MPGKNLIMADTVLRAPVPGVVDQERLQEDYVDATFESIPAEELVVSDNGPQFSADLYASFAQKYGFEHVTSSPHYPQGNGEVERAVKMIKGLLRI